MHRYRIVIQTSLILSIFNLVLAAPIVLQEIHEARTDGTESKMVAPDDAVAMPKKSGELDVAPNKQTSLPSSPDAVVPSKYSSLSDGDSEVSSGYSALHLSSESDLSASGYLWLLDRLPRLNFPESSHGSAPPHDQPSTSGPSELPLHHELSYPNSPGSGLSGISGISTPSTPAWLQELEEVIVLNMQLDGATTGSHTPTEKFTPSYRLSSVSSATIPSTQYASASGGSLTSHYFTASESDGLAPSHNSISEAPSSPGPPEHAKFLTDNMVKKLKIVGGLAVIGTIITGIATPLIKHRDHQDS